MKKNENLLHIFLISIDMLRLSVKKQTQKWLQLKSMIDGKRSYGWDKVCFLL